MKGKLPETRQDQEFLRRIPADFDWKAAELELQEAMLSGRDFMELNVGVLTAVKLILPDIRPPNQSVTMVILNAMEETRQMVGFMSPEILMLKLKQRKEALESTST